MNPTVSRILCLLVLNTLGSGDTQVNRLQALRFADNIKDSYISFIPSAAISQITNKASVCAWLKNPGPSKYPTVFTYESSNFVLSGKGSYNYVAFFGGFPRTTPSSVIAVLAEWHHVCLTFSTASQEAKYYVNGEEAASMAVSGRTIKYSSSYRVIVGNYKLEYSKDYYYGGEVTDLNVYAESLSGEEVQEKYRAGMCSLETDRHEDTRVVSWGEILEQTRSGSVTEFIPTICDVTKLKEKIATQSRMIATLRDQVTSINQSNEDLRDHVTTLKDTNEDLSEQVTTQDQKIKDLSDQVTKQNQTIKDLGDHVTTQNHTIKQLRDQATDLQDTNEELKEKVTTQKESIEDLRDHVTTLKETNEDLIEEVNTLRKCQKKKCKPKQGGKKKEQPEILEE